MDKVEVEQLVAATVKAEKKWLSPALTAYFIGTVFVAGAVYAQVNSNAAAINEQSADVNKIDVIQNDMKHFKIEQDRQGAQLDSIIEKLGTLNRNVLRAGDDRGN